MLQHSMRMVQEVTVCFLIRLPQQIPLQAQGWSCCRSSRRLNTAQVLGEAMLPDQLAAAHCSSGAAGETREGVSGA
jgi:hypothetical protein